jgi:chromosome segregation ATPase
MEELLETNEGYVSDLAALEKKLQEERSSLNIKLEEQSQKKGELSALLSISDSSYENLKKSGQDFGILGVLADFLEPLDEISSRALSLFIGEKAGFFVCENAEQAERALAYLFDNKLGTAGFYVLDELRKKNFPKPSGNLHLMVKASFEELLFTVSGLDTTGNNSSDWVYENDAFIKSEGIRWGGFSGQGIMSRKISERQLIQSLESLDSEIVLLSRTISDLTEKIKKTKS